MTSSNVGDSALHSTPALSGARHARASIHSSCSTGYDIERLLTINTRRTSTHLVSYTTIEPSSVFGLDVRTTLSKCLPRLLRARRCDTINDQGPALYTPNCWPVQDDRSDGVGRAMSAPRYERSIEQFKSHARART
jgi:hypothetical protein